MKRSGVFTLIIGITTLLVIVVGNYSFGNLGKGYEGSTAQDVESGALDVNENSEDSSGLDDLKYPLLVMTFDDGADSDYDIIYPMLSDKGIKGTSYVVGDWLDSDGFMTSEQVLELSKSGWDIQDHTYQHLRLKEESLESVEGQVIENEKVFESIGLETPQHMALPYGQVNDEGREVIAKHKKTIRNVGSTSSGTVNYWDSIDFTNLNAVNIDTTDVDKIKEYIDYAIETKSIIILFGHRIGNDEYQTPLETLDEITDYVVELEIDTATISEMYEQVTEYQKLNH